MTETERQKKQLAVQSQRISNLEGILIAQQQQITIIARLAGLEVDDETGVPMAPLHTLN